VLVADESAVSMGRITFQDRRGKGLSLEEAPCQIDACRMRKLQLGPPSNRRLLVSESKRSATVVTYLKSLSTACQTNYERRQNNLSRAYWFRDLTGSMSSIRALLEHGTTYGGAARSSLIRLRSHRML